MGFLFNQIGIVGVGLIGGSLGLVIKQKKLARQVFGFGRNRKNLEWARTHGLIDDISPSLKKLASHCDLLVLCTPVQTIQKFIPILAQSAKPGTIIMDVGSTKQVIVERADHLIKKPLFFVGAHPMAGKEVGGAHQADKNLFDGKICILTPSSGSSPQVVSCVRQLWRGAGCKVVIENPKNHDRWLGGLSHLPQMSSYALMTTASRLVPQQKIGQLAGRGFRDTTRLAVSPAEMWVDICETNSSFLSTALDHYQKELEFLKNAVQSKNRTKLKRYFEKARRKKLLVAT